jgi:hypothetical protein
VISQAFYLPSYHAGNRDLNLLLPNMVGHRFDLLALPATPITHYTPQQANLPSAERHPKANQLYAALCSGSGMHYDDVLTLGCLCKAYGLTDQEFINVVRLIAAPDSVLQDKNERQLNKLFQTSYRIPGMSQRKIDTLLGNWGCPSVRMATNKFGGFGQAIERVGGARIGGDRIGPNFG